MTSVQAQIRLAKTGLAQPSRKAIAEGKHFAEDNKKPLNKKMLNKAVKYVVYDPFHSQWPNSLNNLLVPALDLVKNGKEPAEEAMRRIVPKINELINKKSN